MKGTPIADASAIQEAHDDGDLDRLIALLSFELGQMPYGGVCHFETLAVRRSISREKHSVADYLVLLIGDLATLREELRSHAKYEEQKNHELLQLRHDLEAVKRIFGVTDRLVEFAAAAEASQS